MRCDKQAAIWMHFCHFFHAETQSGINVELYIPTFPKSEKWKLYIVPQSVFPLKFALGVYSSFGPWYSQQMFWNTWLQISYWNVCTDNEGNVSVESRSLWKNRRCVTVISWRSRGLLKRCLWLLVTSQHRLLTAFIYVMVCNALW